MKIFTEEEAELFRVLAGLSQPALKQSMYLFLRKQYPKKNVVNNSRYIYAIGDIPICLVAHLDTVHSSPVTELYFDKEKDVMWSPQGLGADDRAGVFAITELIKKGYRPHIIFTTDEEKGCIGSSRLAMKPCPFKDVRYFMQIDRRGKLDCVFYDCENPEFTEYIEEFGFIENYGTFTDISELCPEWGIAGVNLSSGYYNEHTLTEYLKTGELKETMAKIEQMLTVTEIPKFEYIETKTPWYMQYYNSSLTEAKGTAVKISRVCGKCGELCDTEQMLPVTQPDKSIKYFCGNCLCSEVNWCAVCGEAYVTKNRWAWDQGELCPICRKDLLGDDE